VLLLALAAALVKISLSGVALRYVRPGMVVLLLITAVILAALAGSTLWRSMVELRAIRAARAAAGPSGPLSDPDGPQPLPEPVEEAPARTRLGWLLLLPLIAVLVVVPPAPGTYLGDRYGTVLAAHAPARFDPMPDGNPVRMTLIEYAARAVVEQGRSLSGRRVALVGFVIVDAEGRPYLTRLVIGCCAADARPIKVGLAGEVPTNLLSGTWIEVEGGYTDRVERDPLGGDLIPYLEVASARLVEPPALPYES